MAVPLGVYLISGSRVRRPASVTLLMFIDRQNSEFSDTGDNVWPRANERQTEEKTLSATALTKIAFAIQRNEGRRQLTITARAKIVDKLASLQLGSNHFQKQGSPTLQRN